MLIREVILENFMSYEYARVPLSPGVNVVCGPNGSGKSSMLLGISVALGQSYTERSRKLSDLIRWGKDQARVTLVLDNSRKGKRKPIPKIKKDYILLTRVLRQDGNYLFELNNKAVTKSEVVRVLSKLGVDPDNMLVIMHQNMVGQFTVLSAQEKLRMVEAAVGLEPYRQNVLNAQRKLGRILSEKESVSKLLESAEQTLKYWREQYDRFQQKKQLGIKRRFLERELAWARLSKIEMMASDLRKTIDGKQKEILYLEDETKIINNQLNESQKKLEQFRTEWQILLEERLDLGCEKAKNELNVSLANQTLREILSWSEASQEQMKKCLFEIERLETNLYGNLNLTNLKTHFTEVNLTYKNLESLWTHQFDLKNEELNEILTKSTYHLAELDALILDVQAKTDKITSEIEIINNGTLERKINLALLKYQEKTLKKDLEKLNEDFQSLLKELNEKLTQLEEAGPRIVVLKTIDEILDEMRVTDGHLAALADVSEDIERMYESYSNLYFELKEKARMVAENREKVLEEVKTRMEAWKTVINGLLNHVNLRYLGILSETQAVGEVRLTNEHDIEEAGLGILVGFKGAEPVALDAYTQSGGERSTATMAFLLALQQHVQSPFRAVDEYDLHMDPKNREIIANILISSVKGSDAQYLTITPSQISFTEKDVHIITVQNVEGTSIIQEVI